VGAGHKEDAEWLYYEVAMTPFEYFGGRRGNPDIISILHAGDVMGLDATAVGCDSTGAYTGMKASGNTTRGWHANYDRFTQHELVRTGVQVTVDPLNYGNTKLAMPCVVKIKDKTTHATLETHNAVLDASGVSSFTTALVGDYDLVCKASHWLAQSKPVTIDASGNGSAAFSLFNADINGDNVVNFSDYLILQTQYKKAPGVPTADINGDGAVNFSDYLILQTSYKKVGDAF
jgi:hypothetical protein